jgi:hypothetical protein
LIKAETQKNPNKTGGITKKPKGENPQKINVSASAKK